MWQAGMLAVPCKKHVTLQPNAANQKITTENTEVLSPLSMDGHLGFILPLCSSVFSVVNHPKKLQMAKVLQKHSQLNAIPVALQTLATDAEPQRSLDG